MRLNEGTYDYCEEAGEPISLKRLDARPITTLSIEAQERHESISAPKRLQCLPTPPVVSMECVATGLALKSCGRL
jgi:RNA polymerase-binding transcription factor DksA